MLKRWREAIQNRLPKGRYERSLHRVELRQSRMLQTRGRAYAQQIQLSAPTRLEDSDQGRHGLEATAYGFTIFCNQNLGANAGAPMEVVSDVYFNFCTFQGGSMSNIKFVNCDFVGATFEGVQFGDVRFEGCKFNCNSDQQGEGDGGDCVALFRHCYFFGSYQKRQEIFCDCDLRWAMFQHCQLEGVVLKDCLMTYSTLSGGGLQSVELRGGDLSGMAIYALEHMDLYFGDMDHILVDEDFFVDHRQPDRAQVRCHVKSLRRVVRLCEYHNLGAVAGEYIYCAKTTEGQALTGIPYVGSWIQRWSCGYGERPSYVFLVICLQSFVFALFYLFTGIIAWEELINYNLLDGSLFGGEVVLDYLRCLFFSVTTYTTVGYGNFVPIGTASMTISCAQMLTGLCLSALWTGCILRKISR